MKNKDWSFTISVSMMSELDYKEMGVLMVLCRYADTKSGQCFPSYETLMSDTNITNRNTMSKMLKSLENKGKITKEYITKKGKRVGVVYTISKYRNRYLDMNKDCKGSNDSDIKNNQSGDVLNIKKPTLLNIKKPTFPSIKSDTETVTNNNSYQFNSYHDNNNIKHKLQNAEYEAFESLVTDTKKEKYYSIVGEYKKVFGSERLIEILNGCMYKGNRFDNTGKFEGYLAKIYNNDNNVNVNDNDNNNVNTNLGKAEVIEKEIQDIFFLVLNRYCTPFESNELRKLVKAYSMEKVKNAVIIAKNQNKVSLAYIKAVCEDRKQSVKKSKMELAWELVGND